jgi:fatty-acyl-CoA synthase
MPGVPGPEHSGSHFRSPFLSPAAPTVPAVPHHAIWPSRLPESLVIPETSLWFNLEVTARRYPHKAAYVFLGRALSFARTA